MCIVSGEVPLPLYSGCRLSSRRPRTSCAVGRVSELPWHSMCPHMMKTMLVGTSERLMSTNISELDVEPGREAGRQMEWLRHHVFSAPGAAGSTRWLQSVGTVQ